MAIESEIVVIGGGLAGLTAAITAAREGADVRLLSAKQSTLRQASGLIDVLGYIGEKGPIAEPLTAIDELPDDHPYATVGAEAIRDGLALFDDVVGDAYAGGHTDRNALVPTVAGTLKPTARYPRGVADGVASDDRDTLLVGFDRLVEFDAPLAAANLAAAGVPFDVRGVTIEFPVDVAPDATVTRFARLLDRDGADEHDGLRSALAAAVRPDLDDTDRVGFPAVLGEAHHAAVLDDLEQALGPAVFEVPMGPPSLPGVRLEDRLFEALDRAGASIVRGNPVVSFEATDGRIETVFVEKGGQRVPYHATEFVLATGGLVGTGVASDRTSVREPIFDCHVAHPKDRYDWFDDDAFGDHPFARFGVATDDALRPLDGRAVPEFDNLRAAGSVLGGYDLAAEKSGSGVSLATGHVAGARAAEAV